MEISDLEHRLQSLEPLRQQAGAVSKIGTLLRLWMTRMGGMLVLALALSMGAAWAGLDGEQIAPWALLAAAGGFVVPTLAGLAWVLPATYRVVRGEGDADAAHRDRLREQVLRPLVQGAVPASVIGFAPPVDLAALERRGLFARPLQGLNHVAALQVQGIEQGHAWAAQALRLWEYQSASSDVNHSRVRIVTVHDGLIGWVPLPGRCAGLLRVADRETAARELGRRAPVATLLGRAPEPPATGDAGFDGRFIVLGDAGAGLPPAPLRRALCEVHDALGTPLLCAVSPEGIAVALPERGRFAGVEASAQVLELIRWQSAAQTVTARAAALHADAALLARLPGALAVLARALDESGPA